MWCEGKAGIDRAFPFSIMCYEFEKSGTKERRKIAAKNYQQRDVYIVIMPRVWLWGAALRNG